MSDPLLSPYRSGVAEPREGVGTWCVIALLTISFVGCLAMTWILVPRAEGGTLLQEVPVAMGSWQVAWGPTVTYPVVEQETRVRALRQVAVGVSGILALLALLIAAGLWRQRLRLRRHEYYVLWAVGARGKQLAARLVGQGSRWGFAIAGAGLALSLALPPLVARTFPGRADVPPTFASALIALAGLAVVLLRWESRAGERAAKGGHDALSRVLASPVCIASLGLAALTAVGLLSAHAPTSPRGAAPLEASVAGLSLGGEGDGRLQEMLTWISDVSASVGPLGLASAGSVRGTGVATHVWVDCGRCYVGGLPLPIRTVRAEVYAVAPDTFPHLGLHIVSGRDFATGDSDGAIVSQTMAHQHFERGEAVGRQLRVGEDRWVTVIGIVTDREDARGAMEYAVYLPLIRAQPSEMEVIGEIPVTTLRDALTDAPHGVSVGTPSTISALFRVHGWFARLLEAFGVLAYVLVLLGVWLGRWHEVRALEFEISLRKAVGARRRDLLARFALVTLRNVVIFAVAGTWLSLFFAKGLGTAYGAIPGADPTVWVSVGAPIVAAYVLASWAPYAHAMRIHPAVGLRDET